MRFGATPLLFIVAALGLAGCVVNVDKSLYVDAAEARFPEVAEADGAGGAASAENPAADSEAAGGRSDATRQTGPISIHARWESATEADTRLQNMIRGAIEAVLTGQGTASGGTVDAGGDDGGDGGAE